MKECDTNKIESGTPSRVLMERAAASAARAVISEGFDISKTLIVCGSGNNGGDGFAMTDMLSHLARENGLDFEISLFFCASEEHMTEECRYQREKALLNGFSEVSAPDFDSYTLIIDAIFGIGLSRELSEYYKDIIKGINRARAKVVSLDIPSGIHADTGASMGASVTADLTVSFASFKIGQFLSEGSVHCGKLICADIGIGTEVLGGKTNVFTSLMEAPFKIPCRDPLSNKGSYGKVLVVGGAKGMAGAAYLSAKAAYRMGAGLVKIFTSEKNRAILQTLIPEAVLSIYEEDSEDSEIIVGLEKDISEASVIILGPGLSQSERAKKFTESVLHGAACPVVADADALNIIASDKSKKLLKSANAPIIITPHMGEMSRLTGVSVSELKADAVNYCKAFATEHGVVCVMKDARSVVSDGKECYINPTGCSGLSKGGSGDVLSGIIGGLLANKMPPFEAASTGTWLHGKAGELASEDIGIYSLLAREIADYLPRAIKETM